ncbi:PfkB family carbohydrate kinase [Nocardia sp. NPDC050435]|uniref:PfkB family carbohydrate kinase n=1 Tax=Nocardia sp. NPDC050435 TaxID=3155040 RepID=UPI0033EB6B6C
MSVLFAGLSTLDIAYAVDTYPAEDSKTQATDQFLGAGGPACNAAVAYAICSGRTPTLITALGQHHLAEIVRRDLEQHGVDVVDATPMRVEQPPVSSIIVARETQSRTIIGLDAAGITAPFDPALQARITDAEAVVIDGHYPELVVGVAECARDAGVPVILDAGRWKPVHDKLITLSEVVICSQVFRPPGFSGDETAMLAHLRGLGAQHSAITRAADSIVYSSGTQSGEVAVAAVDAVDTLGAGDIAHGAFAHYYTASGDFVNALGRAAAVATLSCRSFGTRRWAGYLTELS